MTSLSVIVPVYDGMSFIPTFFRAWREQIEGKASTELILVDNGSSDGSYDYLLNLQLEYPRFEVFSYTDKQSSYAARNAAVRRSKAPFLLFTDIDCIPNPQWVLSAEKTAELASAKALVAGKVSLFPRDGSFNAFEWFDCQSFLKTDQLALQKVGVTANLFVSRLLFEEVGGFSEMTSGSDVDFSNRAVSAGAEFAYARDMCVGHPARSTQREVIKKIDRVALGKAEHCREGYGVREKLLFVSKQLFGLVIQPAWWRGLRSMVWEPRFSLGWKFRYAIISLRLWSRYRLKILRNL
ncbi:MAG: glycosyltransferase [Verrucomicrobiota bacterium]